MFWKLGLYKTILSKCVKSSWACNLCLTISVKLCRQYIHFIYWFGSWKQLRSHDFNFYLYFYSFHLSQVPYEQLVLWMHLLKYSLFENKISPIIVGSLPKCLEVIAVIWCCMKKTELNWIFICSISTGMSFCNWSCYTHLCFKWSKPKKCDFRKTEDPMTTSGC